MSGTDLKTVIEKIVPDSKRAFWLSFCLCLFICLIIIYVISPIAGISSRFGGQGHDGYIELARNLAKGNGYVFEKGGPAVFHRPPLYPFLLVPITYFPENLQRVALILLQSLVVGAVSWMIFKIGGYLFNSFSASAAVIIFLLNPWVYWNAKNPMTPILQSLLYSLLVILAGGELLSIIGRSNPMENFGIWTRRIALGVIAGALALTHGAMLAVDMLLFFVLFIFAASTRNYKAAGMTVVGFIIMAGIIAPWTYRNLAVFDCFIPVTGGSGLAYFNGNVHWNNIIPNPQHKGESYIDASLRVAGIAGNEATHTNFKGLKDIKLEDIVNKKMSEDMHNHPAAFTKKVLLNAVEYYFPVFTYPYLAIKKLSSEDIAVTLFNLILWLFAAIGIVGLWKEKKRIEPFFILMAIVLYAVWYFPFACFIGHNLYTFGTMPFLSILAANGVRSLTALRK